IGLPIHSLTVATNSNDILTRFFESGTMKMGGVTPSISPSMDIQVSSNFERYLFDLVGRDSAALRKLMEDFAVKKQFAVSDELRAQAQTEFRAQRGSDAETMTMMQACYNATGIIIDPHTAVGLHAATRAMEADPAVPMVVLACAHPAKFPEAVMTALGQEPVMPARLAAVLKKAEHLMVLPHNLERLKSVVRQNLTR
ncbi:MAG: threonine synthase, partial [Alphaproteobacteria bacterium]|nr:threonine synthase [Alphaproteobacteria bacterium]